MSDSLALLSPEAQVLLLSAGGARNDARLRALLAGPFDWDTLVALAARERAAPVLWTRLRAALGANDALAAGAAPLERLARVSDFRMLHLEQRLAESLGALAGEGIDAMLLKGAALAITLYGSFTRRPMFDLDLLLRPGTAPRAREVLLGAGWETTELEDLREFFAGHHHLPALADASGTGVQLELHTALFFVGHPFRLTPEALWERGVRISVGPYSAWAPSTHDQLLHLCLHFAWSHMMTAGAWRAFRDVDALVASGRVEWPGFVMLARESRGASCCYWTLRLARALSGVEVPDAVLAELAPPLPGSVRDRVERHFATSLFPTEASCPSVAASYAMWRLGVRPGWSGHGGVRPWDRADDLLVATRPRQSSARRLADQVRNVGAWRRYLGMVLR